MKAAVCIQIVHNPFQLHSREGCDNTIVPRGKPQTTITAGDGVRRKGVEQS
jgi:hypothetical protein